jgi:hypothetical protein
MPSITQIPLQVFHAFTIFSLSRKMNRHALHLKIICLVGTVLLILCWACVDKTYILEDRSLVRTDLVTPASSSSFEDSTTAAAAVVYVIESGGYHDEVTAAFAFSFAGLSAVDFRMFLKATRFGIEAIYNSFFPSGRGAVFHLGPPFPADHFRNGLVPVPDVVVLITCARDLDQWSDMLKYLLTSAHTQILCVVHYADAGAIERSVNNLTPWVKNKRITLIALSPHVARQLTVTMSPWWNASSGAPPVTTFVPVFPVKLDSESVLNITREVVVQGNFVSDSRNNTKLLHEFMRMASKQRTSNATVIMHLLGAAESGVLSVPAEIAKLVRISTSLPYTAFYKAITGGLALIPAFAHTEWRFLNVRASSTVPASVITGCPLVASSKLLSAYSYLDESSVWLRRNDESELDVVERALGESTEAQWKSKRYSLARLRQELLTANSNIARIWVEQAVANRHNTN